MKPKDEEEIKKMFAYKHNTLAGACQNLKEVVMKAYSKPFLMICGVINGIITTIKREHTYNRAINIISNSKITMCPRQDIEYLAWHSPLTIYSACEVYPFLQAYNLGRDEIIRYAYMTGGNVEAIKHIVVKNLVEPPSKI